MLRRRYLQMGVLMRLDAYTSKDLQHVWQILAMAEADGVTDIRLVREMINNHIYQRKSARINRQGNTSAMLCPECGSAMVVMRVDDLDIAACGKCRWSRVITEVSDGGGNG